jgi:hypothetical protein
MFLAPSSPYRKQYLYRDSAQLLPYGLKGDPYEALIRAKETAIHLVMINGIGRYGT